MYATDGTLLNTFKVVGYAQTLLAQQMTVSADGMMLMTLTSDPLLVFIPVGP